MSNPIIITLHVDASAAVREGKGAAGKHRLELGPEQIAALTERQRETLAKHLEKLEGWGDPLTAGAEPIGRADIGTLCKLLDRRYETMSNAAAALVTAKAIDFPSVVRRRGIPRA